MKGESMKKNNKINIFVGIILIIYGLSFPGLTFTWSISIIENIKISIDTMDSGQLLIASISYVFKCLITYATLYFGSLLVAKGNFEKKNVYQFQLFYIGLVLLNILLLNQIYNESFSFLTHILSLGFILFLELFIPKQRYYYTTVFILLIFVLGSVLWLNVIPSLSKYSFGTEEIAISLKIADRYLTDSQLSTTLFYVFFSLFFIISIIFTILVFLYNKQILTLNKYQNQAMELEQTRLALVESKVYQEIHTLVHDLKTPLATIEGLISLMQLKYQDSAAAISKDYFNRLENSLHRMNEMISEILYEDIKNDIPVQNLLDYVLSHIPLNNQNIDLLVDVEENLPEITINKIRFARAISNIIENSIVSLKGQEGKIEIVAQQDKDGVIVTILDNGPGIDEAYLRDIWREGFSKKNSTGLGLSFVKRVIRNHGAEINVTSRQGYTETIIFIPTKMKEGTSNDPSN